MVRTYWVHTPLSNSHHQDHYIISRESLLTIINIHLPLESWVGGQPNVHLSISAQFFFHDFPEDEHKKKTSQIHSGHSGATKTDPTLDSRRRLKKLQNGVGFIRSSCSSTQNGNHLVVNFCNFALDLANLQLFDVNEKIVRFSWKCEENTI